MGGTDFWSVCHGPNNEEKVDNKVSINNNIMKSLSLIFCLNISPAAINEVKLSIRSSGIACVERFLYNRSASLSVGQCLPKSTPLVKFV